MGSAGAPEAMDEVSECGEVGTSVAFVTVRSGPGLWQNVENASTAARTRGLERPDSEREPAPKEGARRLQSRVHCTGRG